MGGILLIDAEQPFADQLASSLTGRGFSVKLLDDGKDGLDYARDNRPDLIVLCVELPKMSGYSICNKLKKDNDLKGIPLIITSKEATPETFAQHKKLKTRAEDYLIKPFSDGELVEKIGSLIALPSPGSNGATSGGDDAFDALDSLGADLDLGGSGAGSVKMDESDLSAFDASPSSGGLSPEEDDLLASFDDVAAPATGSAVPGLDDLELGGKDEGLAGFEQAFESISPEPAPPPPRAEPRPVAASMPPSSSSTADLQQLSQLRRESSDLKARVAELEARLKAAEESARSKDAQIAAAASGGGGAGSAREVLNLKEQLRAKEKEIGSLKDEVFEKEKANVELQEQIESVRAEAQHKFDAAKSKEIEISTLQAKVAALTEERDSLEQQVEGRMRQAESDRDEARAALDQAKSDLQRARSEVGTAKQQSEARIKELEGEVRTQEERAVKAYQRLKTEETLREKAKKAVEIAFTLLSGDVETGGKAVDLDQLDAE